MEANKILSDLNLSFLKLSKENGKTVCYIEDSNKFSKIYSVLDKSDKVDLIEDKVLINEHVSEFIFEGDNYKVKIIGNFDTDTYKLIILGV